MKKIKLLLLGIVSILGIGCSFADFSVSGQVYEDGIYYNSGLGLITVISDTNIATLQDKNLGATKVYDGLYYDNANTVGGSTMYGSISNDSVDVLGSNNYMSSCDIVGNLYQWGNNYGFDCSGVLSTMLGNGPYDFSTVVNYDYNNYGPDNPLSSSTLLSSGVWRSPNANLDIWGGITGTPESQQGPCPDGYYIQNETDWGNFKSMLLNISGSTVITKNVYNLSYFLKLPVVFNINTNTTYDSYWLSSFQGKPSSRQLYPGLVIKSEYNSSNNTLYQTYYLSPNQAPKYFITTPTVSGNGSSYLTPIRCFKNTPVLPSNNWVSLIGGDTSVLPDPEPDDGTGNGDIFNSPVDGGIFDINAFLVEKAVLCYMSNGTYGGEYGNCEGINYTGFINQFDVNYVHWTGSSIDDYYGFLEFNNAKPILEYYCINVGTIDYPFCSQLDLYEGAYLLYAFSSGHLDYLILGSGFGIDLGNLGSGQLGSLTCYGSWCNNFSQGFPQYFRTGGTSIGSYGLSGFYLSLDYYKNFFSEKFFFSCPYSYSGSYFTIGNGIIEHLGGRDPLKPINCFIAAFTVGSKVSVFGDPRFGTFFNGTLLSGDSAGYQRLFLFFDIILSIGYIFFFSKLFKFLKHR